jgi:hypothetical protein
MRRHDVDSVSLFSGVAFLLIAGGYTLTHATDLHLDWLLAVSALLVLVGAAVVVSVARRMRGPGAGPDDPDHPATQDGSATPTDPSAAPA